MNIFRNNIDQIKVLNFFFGIILFYSISISSWKYSAKQNRDSYFYLNKIPQGKIHSQYPEINNLDEKLLLDLSKNNLLPLINKDSKISISLDLEGKIIGYKSSKSRMPNYWNSEFIKKILKKNNLFSLSFKRDQIVSFKLLC
jgi:hypothetical protein